MILSYDLLKPEDEKEDNKDKTSIKEEIDLFNQCKSFYYYTMSLFPVTVKTYYKYYDLNYWLQRCAFLVSF